MQVRCTTLVMAAPNSISHIMATTNYYTTSQPRIHNSTREYEHHRTKAERASLFRHQGIPYVSCCAKLAAQATAASNNEHYATQSLACAKRRTREPSHAKWCLLLSLSVRQRARRPVSAPKELRRVAIVFPSATPELRIHDRLRVQ